MRTCGLLVAALSALIVAGCGGDKLSRPKAAELIKTSEKFSAPSCGVTVAGRTFHGFADYTGEKEISDALVSLGLLTRKESGFALTPDGVSASKDWREDPKRPGLFRIPLARREFGDITGIVEPAVGAGGNTEAQFTWQWTWAPMGVKIADADSTADTIAKLSHDYGYEISNGKPTFELHHGRAAFRRYDDGWRVENFDFKREDQ
jgi:hypothetical protein